MALEVDITEVVLNLIAIDLIFNDFFINDVVAHELKQQELQIIYFPSVKHGLQLIRIDAGFYHLRDFVCDAFVFLYFVPEKGDELVARNAYLEVFQFHQSFDYCLCLIDALKLLELP